MRRADVETSRRSGAKRRTDVLPPLPLRPNVAENAQYARDVTVYGLINAGLSCCTEVVVGRVDHASSWLIAW